MANVLTPADGHPRVLQPTTTTKMAERILAASRVFADSLPDGINSLHALDILLELYVAEDDAHYPRAGDLDPPSAIHPGVTRRWIAALEQRGLLERRGALLALTGEGHRRITTFLQTLYAAQRELD